MPSESLVTEWQVLRKLSPGGWRKGSVVTVLPAQVGGPEFGSPATECKARSWTRAVPVVGGACGGRCLQWAMPAVDGGGMDRADRPLGLIGQPV